jgi:hypothetical protein
MRADQTSCDAGPSPPTRPATRRKSMAERRLDGASYRQHALARYGVRRSAVRVLPTAVKKERALVFRPSKTVARP